jgi:ABC-type maltose transport system permease subunit
MGARVGRPRLPVDIPLMILMVVLQRYWRSCLTQGSLKA